MDTFKSELISEMKKNSKNQYGKENFDEYRFGKYENYKAGSYPQKFIKLLKNVAISTAGDQISSYRLNQLLGSHEEGLNYLWENLTENDKNLLVNLIAYRLQGYQKVKLPVNNKEYWEGLSFISSLKDANDTYDPNFLHFLFYKIFLDKLGFDISLYYSEKGVLATYVLEQYAYKVNNKKTIFAKPGDYVLDCGGCYGDTALYFANQVGNDGKVFSFEFIPNNIKLFNINTGLNKQLEERIQLVPHPVIDQSDKVYYFKDNGPGSVVKENSFEGQTGEVKSISIDDFVERNSVPKIDFIKMDIEGAEPLALKGAEKIIRQFKPNLAIAIYHSMDDFVNIPKWIIDLDLGYKIYLGHYTIHREETVIFASVE